MKPDGLPPLRLVVGASLLATRRGCATPKVASKLAPAVLSAGIVLGSWIGASEARAAEDLLDRVGEVLTFSAADGGVRARVSGLLDLEAYDFTAPAPGFIATTDRRMFVPRLAVFLDTQLGSRVYVFAQARADRGFDPGDGPSQVRLDEYAVRLTLPGRGRVSLQAGKFATVVGNWTTRHDSWASPFLTAPLPYETLTGVWDSEAVRSANTLLQWSHVRPGLPAGLTAREKGLRIPIVWGPAYASGVAAWAALGKLRYALEVKHAPLSSRPETWSRMRGHWTYPTVGGRLSYRPNPMWEVGTSASAGSYLLPTARTSFPSGHGRGDYRQLVFAQDASFAWHHLQLWSELYAARFEIPLVGHADTLAYYAEAKYKFTPRLFGALRWNEQLYGSIPERGVRLRWGRNTTRADCAAGFRFTPHTQLKVQYARQDGDVAPRQTGHTWGAQLTVRF